jgi:hypothetical protein
MLLLMLMLMLMMAVMTLMQGWLRQLQRCVRVRDHHDLHPAASSESERRQRRRQGARMWPCHRCACICASDEQRFNAPFRL